MSSPGGISTGFCKLRGIELFFPTGGVVESAVEESSKLSGEVGRDGELMKESPRTIAGGGVLISFLTLPRIFTLTTVEIKKKKRGFNDSNNHVLSLASSFQ